MGHQQVVILPLFCSSSLVLLSGVEWRGKGTMGGLFFLILRHAGMNVVQPTDSDRLVLLLSYCYIPIHSYRPIQYAYIDTTIPMSRARFSLASLCFVLHACLISVCRMSVRPSPSVGWANGNRCPEILGETIASSERCEWYKRGKRVGAALDEQ